MKKSLMLLLLCSMVAVNASAQVYEDIAELMLNDVGRLAAVVDDVGYGITRTGDINVFDLSDLMTLTSFTTLNPTGSVVSLGSWCYSSQRYGDYLFCGTSAGLFTVDISDPPNPSVLGSVATTATPRNMVVVGQVLVICEDSSSGSYVTTWDISTPSAPMQLGSVAVPDRIYAAAVNGDYLYTTTGFSGTYWQVIDFSDPTNMSILNSFTAPLFFYQMNIVNGVMVCSRTSDVMLFDITTDPLNPAQLDSTTASGRVQAVDGLNVLFGDQAYEVGASALTYIQTWDTHGGAQGDGFPYGSDVGEVDGNTVVLIAQSQRILVLRDYIPPQPLMADTTEISGSLGGSVNFTLDAQPVNAGRQYILLGSVTGTSPGTDLPGGLVTLPLNFDIFTDFIFLFLNTPICVDFFGNLDVDGKATAKFDTLGPVSSAIGVTAHFAFCMNKPFDFASNAVGIDVIP